MRSMTTLAQTLEDAWVQTFEDRAARLPGTGRVADLRKAAIQRVSEHGIPTTRNEEWKYTNVARALRQDFSPAPKAALNLQDLPVPVGAIRLVFSNGRLDRDNSTLGKPEEGVTIESLAAALDSQAHDVVAHFGHHAEFADASQALVAVNTALSEDGAVIRIAEGKAIQAPIYLVFAASGLSSPAALQTRSLILAGARSEATVVEIHCGSGDTSYWSNHVTEAVLDQNAILNVVKIQQEGPQAVHTSTFQGYQERASALRWHVHSLSGRLIRNDTNTILAGEGSDVTTYGLYTLAGAEHVDNHTLFDHAAPHTTSNELYKGIQGGDSTGVFNGKIIVREDAQKTNAYLNNKNLLLSQKAVINTKPQLEIFADDVRCTHGATVGQIEEDSIFYLQARGIPREQARLMLIQAFAGELVDALPVEELRTHVRASIASHLGSI